VELVPNGEISKGIQRFVQEFGCGSKQWEVILVLKQEPRCWDHLLEEVGDFDKRCSNKR